MTKTATKENLADKLDQVPSEQSTANIQKTKRKSKKAKSKQETPEEILDRWDEHEFIPLDYMAEIPIDSLESQVGYSSLFRQMHKSFNRTVAFYRSTAGGSLDIEEARAAAFHACNNREEAAKLLDTMMSLPLDILHFVDLMKLQNYAPRVAERFWEYAKFEGRKEFESGHLAANISFPVGYMKEVWNIARYMGVRESFIQDWQPKGGIEVSLIDMMAQTWFQWQYWIEQTVKRSHTEPRTENYKFREWKKWNKEANPRQWSEEGYWDVPLVSEDRALEQAVQMADRFNRIYLRTLRQLRDLRRYSPVTINNPNQVNIAADGGQQVNVSNADKDNSKSIIN